MWEIRLSTILILASVAICEVTCESNSVFIKINTNVAIQRVSDKFLSLALEASLVQKDWETFDVSSERLLALTRGLAPCYMRFGGTSADFLTFVNTSGPCKADNYKPVASWDWSDDLIWLQETGKKHYTNFTMTACDWQKLNTYVKSTGLRLLFDLNVLLRQPDGSWDSRNAETLLSYSVQKGYHRQLDWELGNEPDSFHHAVNRSLSARQLGKDWLRLYQLVRQGPLAPYYRNSLLVGPDITKPSHRSLKYLKQYLDVVKDKVNAVTWHQYYMDGRTATVDDFIDPDILDMFPSQAEDIKKTVTAEGLTRTPIWLGETGSAWGGGAEDLSDRYAAGFLYMDKLGQAALHGIEVVIRQSWYGGRYGMIDHNLAPLPDYWLALLHKQLVGQTVLNVSSSETEEGAVRMYAHCTESNSSSSGSITLFGMNLKSHTVEMVVTMTSQGPSEIHEYLLTPGDEMGLKSSLVALNGKVLTLTPDDRLPPLMPRTLTPGQPITLPPRTFGFWVLVGVQAKAC